MRRRFARVKWLARKASRDSASCRDLGERRFVPGRVFLSGCLRFARKLGKNSDRIAAGNYMKNKDVA